jgi:lauroyl/myristoyl acyltransferase
MKFFGYVNKDDKIFLTAHCSNFEVGILKNSNFVKKFIEIFEAENMEAAYKKVNNG